MITNYILFPLANAHVLCQCFTVLKDLQRGNFEHRFELKIMCFLMKIKVWCFVLDIEYLQKNIWVKVSDMYTLVDS